MEKPYAIRFIEHHEMEIIIPLLQQLNSNIAQEVLESRLKDMLNQGYLCVGIFNAQKLIGISGLWVLTKYYVGKHIEPDNVFILPEYQGKGIGTLLMNWIFDYAKSIGCVASELNCYTSNTEGHKFWKQQGYEIMAYHFLKRL